MRIRSKKLLGSVLEKSPSELSRILRDRAQFERTTIKRIKGKERSIYQSWGSLREVQDKIKKLLDLEAEHDISHACKGRSAFTNARLHEKSAVLLTLDIKNFFPSISVKDVFWVFVRLGCSEPVARWLARFTTHEGKLPQGCPTSSKLSSLMVVELDRRLASFCESKGLAVSRYVDDISVSGKGAEGYRSQIISMVRTAGFEVQEKKTKLAFAHQEQSVTGLRVNCSTNVGRKKKRELRALCHACAMRGIAQVAKEQGDDIEKFCQRLRGKLTYAAGQDFEWREAMFSLAGLIS